MNFYGVFILGVNIKYGLSFVSLGSKVAYTGERVKCPSYRSLNCLSIVKVMIL